MRRKLLGVPNTFGNDCSAKIVKYPVSQQRLLDICYGLWSRKRKLFYTVNFMTRQQNVDVFRHKGSEEIKSG